MNVTIDGFADAIIKELDAYAGEVTVATKQAVEETAEQCRQDISAAAPGSGHYAQSWRKKQTFSSADENRFVVYSKKYQLTHLLEYGHKKWLWGYYTGDRVDAKPHIRPAEEKAGKNLVNTIKRKLS